LRDFIKAKEQRPPEKFANEHKLNPPFEGLSECHLAGDSCLVFKDKGDTVQLLLVCNHDELRGKKAKALAKKLKHALA
jgi:mRNA-degrading endonuclease YafQ of YafQ-DinJ toxin-antitoxin module